MSEFEKELEKSKSHDRTLQNYYHKKILIKLFKDWKPPKPLTVVPKFVAEYIERCKSYGCGLIWAIRPDRDANDNSKEVYDWLFPNGYRLEDGSFPDPFEPDNLVRPDSGNQLKFVCAWIDGYTVEKEQLYEVVTNGLYLVKLMNCDDSKSHRFIEKDELVNWKETGYRLTAKQIKMIDERYMAFAVKVDEVKND